ncbi:MAG: hypothetical protein M1368_10800 [Thaumarchaeota archaeon]|nr:hypothetical protein [Nitrososphaerota archaeon]
MPDSWFFEACYDAQKCALPATGWPNYAQKFSVLDIEADSFKYIQKLCFALL